MIPTVKNNHAATAVAHLTDAFRNKPNTQALTSIFASELQEAEDALWVVMTGRILANNPTADQLDRIGSRLGELRNGRPDAIFLNAIKLKIRVLQSNGTPEDVIAVAALLVSSFTYQEAQVATWMAEAWNITDAPTLLDQLGRTKAAGSRGLLHYTTYDPALNFAWGSVSGNPANARACVSLGIGTQPTNTGSPCSCQEVSRQL